MTPANFSVRPRSKRRLVAPIAIGLLLIAIALVYIGSRNGTSPTRPFGTKSSSPTRFDLRETGFTAVFEGRKPPTAAVREQREAVHNLFTGYYFRTFVNPAAWRGNPPFGGEAKLFTPEARAAFARDVGSLTIGDGRKDFTTIRPSLATIKSSVYFDAAGRPAWAVAVLNFRATALGKSLRPATVVHGATYRLQKTATGWLIFSYEATQKQDTPPSASPSPAGSPS